MNNKKIKRQLKYFKKKQELIRIKTSQKNFFLENLIKIFNIHKRIISYLDGISWYNLIQINYQLFHIPMFIIQISYEHCTFNLAMAIKNVIFYLSCNYLLHNALYYLE